jgi:hypothetical protein
MNEEKPRKGCFEITANGQVVISMLNMQRPFTVFTHQALQYYYDVFLDNMLYTCNAHQHKQTLKALDMDDVVKKIIDVLEK